jgi:peptidoglycan/xylan/chitin deacetylase (PgdA/CDA1 family)
VDWIIEERPWNDPTGTALRAAQRAELDARYGTDDHEPGPPPSGADVSYFVVATTGGRAVGCGALRAVDASSAEVKRMYVEPAERGTGVATAILDALEAAVGGMPAADGYRGLSVSQLVDLHRRGHEIGSHTVTHPILPALDDAALAREIADARRALAGWLGTDVAGFCYPNGDHDERVVARVARAGHAYACTTLDGIHYPGDDPFRIRRVSMVSDRVAVGVRRFDPTAFRRELCGLYRRRGRPPVGS